MTDILLECYVDTAVEVQVTPLDADGVTLVGGITGVAAVAPEGGVKQSVAIAADGSITFVPDSPGLWSLAIKITAPVQASGDAYVRVNPLILEP
jgi:hypothetical protein